MQIDITQNDLDQGDWNSDNEDPICLAIRRHIHPDAHIYLDFSTLLLWNDKGMWHAQSPNSFVDSLRLKPKYPPFSINIHIPEAFLVPHEIHNAS